MIPSIYQRKSDGKWVGALELPPKANGKRNRIVKYGNDPKEIKRIMNEIVYEIEHGEYIQPTKDTFVNFLKEYHQVCAGYDMWSDASNRPEKATWDVTTASLYKMYIDVHFAPYFKDMKLLDIKPMVLDKFYNCKLTEKRIQITYVKGIERKKTLPPLKINTVIKLNKFLKSAFNYAVVNDLIKKNPTAGIKLGSKEEYKPNVYDEEQFLKLLNFVKGTDDEIYILIAAGCGLRRGEICGLEWGNIDFENHTIAIEKNRVRFDKNLEKDPKNEKSKRTISAPDYVLNILSQHKANLGIVKSDSKIITRWKPQSLSERFNKLLKKFDMPATRLHDLRHYNAVVMMNYGIPDKVAAERLGHSDVQMLHKVYQHVQKNIDEKAAVNINDMFKKQNSHKD